MASTNWQLDAAHSEVTFRVRHLVIATVSGKFDQFASTVHTDGDDFTTAEIEFTVETGSINTGVEARDNHLGSDDFFNSEKFPAMTFKSKGVKKGSNGDYQLERKEFGLRWDALTEAGGAVVSDEVKIQANVQYAKAQ